MSDTASNAPLEALRVRKTQNCLELGDSRVRQWLASRWRYSRRPWNFSMRAQGW